AHPQLSSCYRMFAWGDMLRSKVFMTPGVLSDEFWFWVLKQFCFFHIQFSRFVGAPFRADNHHLMERGVALYFMGVQFPEFAFAREMEAYSCRIIRQHFDHNILKDGAGSEHCCSYQYRCFIRYALPDSVGRLNGRDVLGPDRAKRMHRFLLFQGLVCAPDGKLPDVGDGGGTPISEVVAQSGAMYESAELKAIDAAIGTQELAINPAYAAGFKKIKPRLPRELAAVYPIGGHLALRDGWKKDANFLWLGLKNGSLYNVHTHWDTLSFAMSAFGRTLIGDPVGRTYGRMEDLARGYYFSMDAHNGLIVDDDILTSYKALAKWWGGQPPRIDSAFTMFDPQNGFDYASFSHPGYRPLLLRRDVLFVHGRYFLITDGLSMDFRGFNAVFGSEGDIRPHEMIQPLHFEEDVPVSVRAEDHALVTGLADGPNLLIVPEPFENLRVSVKRDDYIAALDPAPGVCQIGEFRRETIGKCFFSTVYRPFRGGPAQVPALTVRALTPRTGPYRQDEFHAIEIRDGEHTDYWVVQRDRQKPRAIVIEQPGVTIRTDAPAALISIAGKRITGFQCGGKQVELNGKRLTLPKRAFTKQPLK
ncbi:MAG TPA: heparinase II/III family protein, partial [Planctomycetota bacterium]|nr:heparinase II/III family protein [Planctomycetota bacterium]